MSVNERCTNIWSATNFLFARGVQTCGRRPNTDRQICTSTWSTTNYLLFSLVQMHPLSVAFQNKYVVGDQILIHRSCSWLPTNYQIFFCLEQMILTSAACSNMIIVPIVVHMFDICLSMMPDVAVVAVGGLSPVYT